VPEITPEEIERVRQWVRTYGPANCWTGTTGSVAAVVLKMLQERGDEPATDKSLAGQGELFA
jgi:hypothetical protein